MSQTNRWTTVDLDRQTDRRSRPSVTEGRLIAIA